jgi:transposase-like protein
MHMQKRIVILDKENGEEKIRCPYCRSKDVIKYGHQRNGRQR